MNKFAVRAASGLTAAVVFIAAFLYSPITYGLAVGLAVMGSVYEFYTITEPMRPGGQKSRTEGVVLSGVAFGLSLLINYKWNLADIGVLLPVILFYYFVKELFAKSENPFLQIGWNILPFIYIVLPVMALNNIYCDFYKGPMVMLAILFMIWFYDSMCYISGSLIGRTKLIERISPNKTIEGLLGGMILTLTLVFFYDKILGSLHDRFGFKTGTYSHWQWLFIGLVTLIFATFGDLVESMLKRSIGVKDSGSIMPGHGGFLDRLDAILVAVPFSMLALWLADRSNDISNLIFFFK